MRSSLKGLAIIASAGLSSLAIAAPNGDFSDVKPFPEDTTFDLVELDDDIGVGFLPSWTIVRNTENVFRDTSAIVSIAGSDAGGIDRPDPDEGFEGTGVFAFEQLTIMHNDSRLEQCVPIVDDLPITFSYRIFINGPINANVRGTINSNFYSDMEGCERDMQAGIATNGLTQRGDSELVPRTNYSATVLEINEWFEVTRYNRVEATTSVDLPMELSTNDIPNGARALSFSLQLRNGIQENNASNPDREDVRLFIDDIQAVQAGVNLLVNSDFSHPVLENGDFLTEAESGWQLALFPREDINPMASAGVLPFALEGEQGFYFKRLTGEYSDSSLVQCIDALPTDNLKPAFNVLSNEPAEGLMAAIRGEFFTDSACQVADMLPDLEGELEIQANPGQWQRVETSLALPGDATSGNGSMRLTLSARDRSGVDDAPDSDLARTLFMDDVTLVLTLPRPTFSPDGESFDNSLVVTVNGPEGSTLLLTMDSTDPTTSSMAVMPGHTLTLTETTELRAVVSDGEALSPVQSAVFTLRGSGGRVTNSSSSSFGCSLGTGASDPMLPLLTLLALMGLMLRRKLQ
ncbi:MAG: hypothetical protein EA349_08985 [Halomonadaceae bacterium]|nr:MAG: hypothetical protein EA349_08985 [Halomonadaceae bacterium]